MTKTSLRLHEMPRLLLQLPADRGVQGGHRAPGEAFRRRARRRPRSASPSWTPHEKVRILRHREGRASSPRCACFSTPRSAAARSTRRARTPAAAIPTARAAATIEFLKFEREPRTTRTSSPRRRAGARARPTCSALERLLADRGRGCVAGGDRVRVDAQLDQRRLARGARALEGRRELLGALHQLAVPAEGARIGGEIRVLQLGARDARPGTRAPGACGWCRTCRCSPPAR